MKGLLIFSVISTLFLLSICFYSHPLLNVFHFGTDDAECIGVTTANSEIVSSIKVRVPTIHNLRPQVVALLSGRKVNVSTSIPFTSEASSFQKIRIWFLSDSFKKWLYNTHVLRPQGLLEL